MPKFPKIRNPFEDDDDSIDTVDLSDQVGSVAQDVAKQIDKNIIKPTTEQVTPSDDDIVNFLYGASDASEQPESGTDEQNIRQHGHTLARHFQPYRPQPPFSQAQNAQPHQAQSQQSQPTMQLNQQIDPDKQMTKQERVELTEDQKEQREHIRVHSQNYFTYGKLDDIGTLYERLQKVRQEREQEEQQLREEEEEQQKKKKEEEEAKKQQPVELPGGKKTGVPEHVLRQQRNKAEENRGTSG